MSTRNASDSAVFNVHHGHAHVPVLGTDGEFSPPTDSRATLIVLSTRLVTDANVADRQIVIAVQSPTRTVRIANSFVLQPANTTYDYIFGIGLTSSVNAINNNVTVALTPEVYLLDDWKWRINVNNIQVGDDLQGLYMHQKVWTYEQ